MQYLSIIIRLSSPQQSLAIFPADVGVWWYSSEITLFDEEEEEEQEEVEGTELETGRTGA